MYSTYVKVNNYDSVTLKNEKKTLRETQTLRAGCSKAKLKKIRPAATPFPGRRTAKI